MVKDDVLFVTHYELVAISCFSCLNYLLLRPIFLTDVL